LLNAHISHLIIPLFKLAIGADRAGNFLQTLSTLLYKQEGSFAK